MIRITAKQDGFRRAGMAHSMSPVDYPYDTFSPEQLESLSAEPMLVVEFLAEVATTTASQIETVVSEQTYRVVDVADQAAVTIPVVAKKTRAKKGAE